MVSKKNLKKIREEYGFSQEDLAGRMGISRPTLSKIESGERKLTKLEESRLNEILGFVGMSSGDFRIDIPQRKLEKFKQVFLYILEKVGGKPNVGMTVLCKLLYFIDFDYYEKYEKQLMGLTYFRNTHGPTPREFIKVVEEMKEGGEVIEVKDKYFTHDQKKFLPVNEPDLSDISGQELEIIDDVLARYSNKSATELSALSHLDTPWACAEPGKDLKYEHVFYRPDQFSVREYGEL